jgi:hypothetical protein
MADALRKFDTFPGDAKTARDDLQKECDTLLETTKDALRAVMSTQDPAEVDTELAKYDAAFGEAINEEKKALVERKSQLFRAAQTEMQQLAGDKDAPIEDLDAMIEKYASWPADVQSARDTLTTGHRGRLTDLTKQAADLQEAGDFAGVESLLAKYGKAMETHMAETFESLKRYQTTSVEQMQVTLKEGLQKESPPELSELIKLSERFGDALQAERKGLETRLADVLKAARDEMDKLNSSEDFPAITESLAKHKDFPEETKEAWDKLQAHWDEVLEKTKEELRVLLTSADPNDISDQVRTARDSSVFACLFPLPGRVAKTADAWYHRVSPAKKIRRLQR